MGRRATIIRRRGEAKIASIFNLRATSCINAELIIESRRMLFKASDGIPFYAGNFTLGKRRGHAVKHHHEGKADDGNQCLTNGPNTQRG